jgi:hypothetical protein
MRREALLFLTLSSEIIANRTEQTNIVQAEYQVGILPSPLTLNRAT